MRSYTYYPRPYGVDTTWDRPIHLYDYLLCTRSERDRIRREINDHLPGELFIARIQHPCLRGMLKYSTVEDDDAFVRRITICREYEICPQNVIIR